MEREVIVMTKILKDWMMPILFAVMVAFLIHQYVFFIAVVPSASMNPTIIPGEKVFVTRVHNPESLKRGDIVVFQSDELNKVLIKRLIALPGDKIQIKNGQVFLNEKLLNEPYVSSKDVKSAFGGEEVQIPEGKYLFLGDNRAVSYDSRYWTNPYIPGDKIMGEAHFVIYPFNAIRSLNKQ